MKEGDGGGREIGNEFGRTNTIYFQLKQLIALLKNF